MMFKVEPIVFDHQSTVRSFITSENIQKYLEDCGLIRLEKNEILKLLSTNDNDLKYYIKINTDPYYDHGDCEAYISSVVPITRVYKPVDTLTIEHELEHTPLRALKQPSARFFWKRRMELVEILLSDDKNKVTDILNQLTLLITYQITDELRSTFVVEYQKADTHRRNVLEKFSKCNIENKLEWPYVSAYNIFSFFKKNIHLISKILDICEFATHTYEQTFEQNWNKEEDANLIPSYHLQKFIEYFNKKDDVNNAYNIFNNTLDNQKLNEILGLKVELPFKLENISKPPKMCETRQQINKILERAWIAWKNRLILSFWQEYDLAMLALYHLSDDICRTFLVVGDEVSPGGIQLKKYIYYLYIPSCRINNKLDRCRSEIRKLKTMILAKLIYFLLRCTPTFGSSDNPVFKISEKKGVKIDGNTIIPYIETERKAIKNIELELTIREELIELLEKYARKTKLDDYYSKKFK